VRSVRRGWVYGKATQRRLSTIECIAVACTKPGMLLTYAHIATAAVEFVALNNGLPIIFYPFVMQVVRIPVHFATLTLAKKGRA
jgi:hypothetical protein